MATKAQLRSDLELRLTAGKPSDDNELDPRQLDFWLDIARNKVISMKIQASGYMDLSGASTLFNNPPLSIKRSEIPGVNDLINKYIYYIEVPGEIMQLPNDGAIVAVRTVSGNPINRIKFSDADLIKNIETLKPSPHNMVFYRVGGKLYIMGPTRDFLDNGSLIVMAVLSSTEHIEDDSEYPMPSDLVADLLDMAEAVGRRQMGTPMDLTNDGVQ